MIKKAIYGSVGLVLLGGLIFGTDLPSYVGTSFGWMKDTVKDSVPVEFQIERAQHMRVIAREEVEVERLDERIAGLESRQDRDKGKLMTLRNDLASENGTFQYAGRSFTRDQVKVDLANRFDRYKTNDATLASLTHMREARLRNVENSRATLDEMLAAKQRLEVEVENLEAQLKMVQAESAASDYVFDTSRLGKAKELIADIRARIEVESKVIAATEEYQGGIPVSEPVSDDIVDEVTVYFGGSEPAEAKFAEK
jgi:hypothetical protein